MTLRRAKVFFLFLGLTAIAACDPEALVKRKVPEPLKLALTFSSTPQPQKPGAQAPVDVTLTILSPESEAFFSTEQPVKFKADAHPKGAMPPDNELVWNLTDEKTKHHSKIGQGKTIDRKLPAGSYVVELVHQAPGGKKVAVTAKFRVGPAAQGKIAHGGRGLADVELVLTDVTGQKVITRGKSDKAGVFYVEVPAEGDFKLTPHKQGFSFSPVFRVVRRGMKPEELEFQSARAQIGDMRLTASEESDEDLETVCPGQTALLKATVSGEAPLTRLDAFLAPQAKGPGQPPVFIGTAEFTDNGTDPARPTQRSIKVQIPDTWTDEFVSDSYGLLVTGHDAKGDSWSAQSAQSFRADAGTCLGQKFEQATALQDQGDLEGALRVYDLIAEVQRTLGQAAGFAGVLEKALFNRGLINLQSALRAEPGSLRRSALLTKALSDFQDVTRLHRKDAEASFFTGLVSHLKGERDAALAAYTAAIRGDLRSPEAYEFRARLLLETQRARNVSRAVDDFTRALILKPEAAGLREARKAALELDLTNQDLPPDARTDTSSVPQQPMEKRLNLREFGRR